MADTLARLCEGPDRRGAGQRRRDPRRRAHLPATREHYLDVIAGKTASLIETSCRYGALLSGVDPAGVDAAAAYGFEVGMAFQLSDDLIDLVADPEVSGKVPGTDLREGVRTLPVLYALEDEAAVGGDELARLLDGELTDADVARALDLLHGSDGLARAREEAAERVRVACDHLAAFGDRTVVTALERLAHYALDRLG